MGSNPWEHAYSTYTKIYKLNKLYKTTEPQTLNQIYTKPGLQKIKQQL